MTDNADIGGCGLYVLSRQEWMEVWIESRRAMKMYVLPHGKEYQLLVKFSPLMQIKPDLDQLSNNKWTIRLFRLSAMVTTHRLFQNSHGPNPWTASPSEIHLLDPTKMFLVWWVEIFAIPVKRWVVCTTLWKTINVKKQKFRHCYVLIINMTKRDLIHNYLEDPQRIWKQLKWSW